MATQFDQPRTVVQPQATEQPANLSGVFDKQASFLSGLASAQFAQSQQLINQASSSFDQALAFYGKEAEKKATDDAAATVKYDGEGNVIAPSTFYPPGISSRAYSERFHDTARALYNASAEDELTRHSTLMKEKFAGDPAAYAKAMDEKRQQMQVNLDPSAAPWLDLRARQIQAQGTSQIAVQAQTVQNKVTAQKSDEMYSGILDEASRLAAFQSGLGSNQTPEQLRDLILNSSMLSERWKQFEATAVAAGYSPAYIQQRKDNLAQNVIIKAHSETVKNSVAQYYDPATGYPNPGAIASARENIRLTAKEFAKKFPGHEEDYYTQVNGALEFATGQAGLRAQQINVNGQKFADPKLRAIALAPQLADDALRAGDLVAADSIRAKLAADTRDYLTDPRIPDSVALKLGQASYAAGGVTLGRLQEANSTRLQGLNAVINDTNPATASPQAKANAELELRAIKADPEVMANMTSGQRAYLQSGLDKAASVRLASDSAGIQLAAPRGDQAPAAFDAMLLERVQKGIDGNHVGAQFNLPQQAQLSAINRDAYNKKATNQELARDAAERSAGGQAPTATQTAAVKAAVPFKLPGEVADYTDPAHGYAAGSPNTPQPESFNPAKPGHTPAVADYVRKWGVMPDRVKDAVDTMPHSTSQAVMQPWIDFYSTMYNVAAEKVTKRTGDRPTDADLRAQVASMIGGDQAKYLSIARRNGELGAETAYKLTYNPTGSVTGNTGQPNAAAATTLDQAAAEYTKTLVTEGQKSSVLNKLRDLRIPGTEGWQPSPEEQASAKAFQSGPTTKPGLIERVTGKSAFGAALPTTVAIDPELDAMAKQDASGIIARDGQAIRQAGGSESAEAYAYRTAMTKLVDAGQAEMIRDPNDPSKATIALKSANKDWAERMGLDRLNDETTRAVATAVYTTDAMLSGSRGADFKKDSVTVKPYVNDAGQPFWYIGATEARTGMRLKLMEVAQNDPRFDAAVMAMDRSAMLTLQKNLVAEDGKPVSADTATRYALAFSRFAQAPFESLLKEHYASGTVLTPEKHAEFVKDFTDRMVAIRQQQGLPSIDWKASLDKIAKDPTPDDGRYGMLRAIASQESAKAEAERTGKPVAPPVTSNPVVPLPAPQPNNTGPDAEQERRQRILDEERANRRGDASRPSGTQTAFLETRKPQNEPPPGGPRRDFDEMGKEIERRLLDDKDPYGKPTGKG